MHFDALQEDTEPTLMFGGLLVASAAEDALRELSRTADAARTAVRDCFHRALLAGEAGMLQLDEIVSEMWRDGWNPATGNLDLFTTHFGSLLSIELLSLRSSEAVFRDARVLDHASVFFRLSPCVEYFPFHKAYKCLCSADGESLAQLFRDAVRRAGG